MSKNLKKLVFIELNGNKEYAMQGSIKDLYNDWLERAFPTAKSQTIKRHISEWRSRNKGEYLGLGGEQNLFTPSGNGNKNVFVIGDLHFPFEHEKAFDFVMRVMELHPEITETVFLGDIIDNHYSSFHDTDPDGLGGNVEYKKARKTLKKWYKAFPNAKVCTGNHDAIPQRKAFNAGLSAKWIKTLPEMYNIPGWVFKDYHKIGDFIFTHGLGQQVVSRAMNLGLSVIQGHTHSKFGVQAFYNDKLKGHVQYAIDGGCLIDSEAYAFSYGKFGPVNKKGLTLIHDIEGVPVVTQYKFDDYLEGLI